jgi:hypothetical protein
MIWRGLREEDLAACLSVDPARIGAETVGYNRAIDAWRDLIRSPSFHSAVIEADPPIAGHSIVAFGASVFVSRAFADEEISNPTPGLNARIITSIASVRPAVLNKAELRSANTEGGLDLVVLCPKWRKGILSAKQVSEVQMLLASSFLQHHLGFRLNRLITEIMDEEERVSYAEASGAWRTISDFSEFYSQNPNTHWERGRSLSITTTDDAFRVPGHICALLFQYREPVLRLQEADQQLLSAALTGLTDDELARCLGIRLPAVKKRWRSLFDRASAHEDLFHDMDDGLEGSGRGRQKRQFILTYVREHPEELQPFDHKLLGKARRAISLAKV